MDSGRSALRLAWVLAVAIHFSGCWLAAGLDKGELLGRDGDTSVDVDWAVDHADWISDGSDEPTAACLDDDDCTDGDECNGLETCSAEGLCLDGVPLPNGTDCTTPSDLPGACSEGLCVPDTCGNGIVDAGEDCDDGDATSGDGCEPDCTFSCSGDADCSGADPCVDGTCQDNDRGRACVPSYTTDACNDGLNCTVTDLCDGAGSCVGSGNACDDGLACTADGCAEGPSGPTCDNHVLADQCLIEGACYTSGAANPANSCQVCSSAASATSWTSVADRTMCSGGICCGGQCRAGGTCCTSAECSGRCSGTAAACTGLVGITTCLAQDGCNWIGAACYGSPMDCISHSNSTICGMCDGCIWRASYCGGVPVACALFTETDCVPCGCTFTAAHCEGAAQACGAYTDSSGCLGQTGCSWSDPACSGYQCQ
jgi:cysteine-rich repeat protein